MHKMGKKELKRGGRRTEMKQKRRCVIVGAAEITEYERIKSCLREDDFFVYCDAGLKHLEKLGRKPELIIGDFDSFEKPETDIETITLPCEKDDTDTVYAVKEAIRRGFCEFLLIGVIGQRLDHTLGNVYILYMLEEAGMHGVILDDYSEMELILEGQERKKRVEDSFAFFSLVNVGGEAEGVTIRNAKYPLENGTICRDYQYGVSNEVIPGKTAEIFLKKGSLLLIKDY